MANVQVILKEKIKGLGAEADVVHVKRGFARNFLVPQGKAYEATAGNLREYMEALMEGARRSGLRVDATPFFDSRDGIERAARLRAHPATP